MAQARRKERRLDAKRRGVDIEIRMQAADFDRYLFDRYGTVLPDDDAGRHDLWIALHLRAPLGHGEPDLLQYAEELAPWLSPGDLATQVDRVYTKPVRFTADTIATMIGMVYANRARLGLTAIGSIDVPKAARRARRKVSKVERRRKKRRAAGAIPRAEWEANSKSRTEPWKALGLKRTKYYELGLHKAGPDRSDTQHT